MQPYFQNGKGIENKNTFISDAKEMQCDIKMNIP